MADLEVYKNLSPEKGKHFLVLEVIIERSGTFSSLVSYILHLFGHYKCKIIVANITVYFKSKS